MRIGILTFHRAYNYGAVLQCYALQSLLSEWGHEVEVIDYRQPHTEASHRIFSLVKLNSFKTFTEKKNYLMKTWKRKSKHRISKAFFSEFLAHQLHLSPPCKKNTIPSDYEAYIIGSDQLWSENCLGGKFDDVYLGNFFHKPNAKLIGYAISINRQSLEHFCKEKLPAINNFTSLSVRESFAAKRISDAISMDISQCIDPTLLLDPASWRPFLTSKYSDKDYILLYQVRGSRATLLDKARALANQLRCDVLDLSSQTFPVEDFISAIHHARCVITSSFHATAFSVILSAPFYSYTLNDGKDSRYVELLESLGLEGHIVGVDFTPTSIPNVDKSSLQTRLASYRKSSLEFLRKSLS